MQPSLNPFSLLGQFGIRAATRSGLGGAVLHTAWSHRHVVVSRITLTSTVVVLLICAMTWKISSHFLGPRRLEILATQDFANTRTDTYTHVHPKLRTPGDSATVARLSSNMSRRSPRHNRVFVRAADYWAHTIASWLNPIAFWGMLLSPLLFLERWWAQRRSPVQRQLGDAPHNVTGYCSVPENRAPFMRRSPMLARPRPSVPSGRLNQSLFGG